MSDFNLGTVTAYGYAKDKGYTGTEAEFAELMASYADVAEQAAESATQAAASATTASTKASEAAASATAAASSKTAAETAQGGAETAAQTATTKAGEATTAATTATNKATEATTAATTATGKATEAAGSATTATTKAGEASTSATNAAASATRAQEILDSIPEDYSQLTEDVSNLKNDFDSLETALETKAEIDGYYEGMTVGNAEQLVSTVTNADDTPYNFRTTAGSADVGDRAYVDAIVGGSLVVNQYFTFTEATATRNGITFVRKADGTITVSGTATANVAHEIITIPLIGGHTYLLTGCPQGGGSGKYALYANDTNPQLFDSGTGSIKNQNANTNGRFYIIVYNGQTVDLTFVPQLFDITQMFGTDITDYVYSLENATIGSGVAWLKANFPKIFNAGYVPYNAGTMVHVSGLSAKKTVGFNQWDEEWELGYIVPNTGALNNRTDRIRSKKYIPVLGGIGYYFHTIGMTMNCVWYDASLNYIRNNSPNNEIIISPQNARYCKFSMPSDYGAIYNHDICINLHWDGEKDGTYEPYTVHTYAFDPTVELRGVPKLKDGKMYFDGDRYLPDGTVQRRYGIVDLGTLNWIYLNIEDHKRFVAPFSSKPASRNLICTKYQDVGYSAVLNNTAEGISIHTDGEQIAVYDTAYTDATAFKTAMSGVYLVYELATPTTETATPYNPVEIVDDFGTEEFITTSLVPVGHETRYAPNLRAKLEMSPDSPDGDGLYIVQQSGGENTYIPLASSATIQNILERLTALEGNTNEG